MKKQSKTLEEYIEIWKSEAESARNKEEKKIKTVFKQKKLYNWKNPEKCLKSWL